MADTYVVKAVNTGKQDVPISHNRELLVVPAKGERIVPWDAMASLWGDPNVADTKAGTRFDQAMHLRGQFGWFKGLDPEGAWDERRPSIEWYTLEGDRIWTVLDDPTGEKAAESRSPRPEEVAPDASFLARTIEEMRQRMDRLQEELDQRNAAVAEADDEKSASTDTGELPAPDPDDKPVNEDTPRGPRIKGK